MDKRQRTYVIVGAGALLLYLLYRHYVQANTAQTAASTSAMPADTTGAAQYAGLAGQEQSDIAGLQAQEQSDVQNLVSTMGQNVADQQAGLTTLQGQEQTDNANLQGLISGLGSTIAGLGSQLAGVVAAHNVPAAASGSSQTSRTPGGGVVSGKISDPGPWVAVNNPVVTGQAALAQVWNMVSGGFKRLPGTQQKGGLAQTGTYVKGGQKFFVYGTQATGLHVRKSN